MSEREGEGGRGKEREGEGRRVDEIMIPTRNSLIPVLRLYIPSADTERAANSQTQLSTQCSGSSSSSEYK